MLLRRFIACLMLSMAFVLSSTYAQAMLHVDDWQATLQVEVDKAKLPPCHHAVKDSAPDDHSGHHGGCCSSFACSLGLVAEYTIHDFVRSSPLRSFSCGSVMRWAMPEPLNPPPKTI